MATLKKSAGILLYRSRNGMTEFFLVHPGGPFWAKKDAGAWSIPKGEFGEDEDPLQAAVREMKEETGYAVSGAFMELTPVKQKNNKLVMAWAMEGDVDASTIKSNLFDMEWPPRSGRMRQFPEVDRAGWFGKEEALEKIIPAQGALILECESKLKNNLI